MTDESKTTLALISAASAVIGYSGKSIVEWWKHRKRERARVIAQLEALRSLLGASRALFIIQQEQVMRLMELLRSNHPNQFLDSDGYEDGMVRLFSVFTDEEQVLHRIIRAYTEHSLRKVNTALSDWLKIDTNFKTGILAFSRCRELARQLSTLEIHLLLWHAKYESWIPGRHEHALVYLADEKKHGLGFPSEREIEADGAKIKVLGMDDEVEIALKELRKKWGANRFW